MPACRGETDLKFSVAFKKLTFYLFVEFLILRHILSDWVDNRLRFNITNTNDYFLALLFG